VVVDGSRFFRLAAPDNQSSIIEIRIKVERSTTA
jgi:hypothetical protein